MATITLTDSAVQHITHLVSQENQEDGPWFFRVAVNGGGCSGFQYHFTLDNTQTPDDHVFPKNGISVVIDSISLGLLSDAMIDYTQDLTTSRFVIKNPNATASCGCGKSFAV